MDFGKAFTYVFDDADWVKKVGIAAVLMLIPFVGQVIVAGWAFNTTRNVVRRVEEPLAGWSDIGDIVVKGLQVIVIGFAYALPIILISSCIGGVSGYMMEDGGDDMMMAAFSIVSLCLTCFSVLYGIFLALAVPAAMGNFAAKDEFGAAFRFSEVFGLVRAAPGPYILVFLGGILAGFISMLGLIACIIGVFFTAAYAAAINGHLQGQAYNAAIDAQGAQAEAAF
jgi:hypothetical protein